jgi:hypothetical protein
MKLYRLTFVAGLATGFVAGTRAGREKYDQLVKIAKTTMDNPTVQQAAGTIQAQASSLLSSAGQKFAEVGPQLAHTAMHKVEDHVPLLRHRDGHGHAEGNAEKGAESGRPFAATSNSHIRPTKP